jgi:hypothetical protein
LSLLIIGMANGQELDAASLNAILPEGFTPVCEEGQEPNPFGTRSKRQIGGDGPPPCWHINDDNLDNAGCAAAYDGNCENSKPYVERGHANLCIYFAAPDKWFRLRGTYGWCGADGCCDFQPKGSCNPVRPLASYFPLSGFQTCAEVSNPDDFAVTGAELMKGEEGTERVICIKNEDGIFVEEIVKLNDCGGLGCCRFEFKDAPAEE